MRIQKYNTKSLIRTSRPSIFAWSEVYFNPYQGCYHDCKYCDGKSEGYYMHDDFVNLVRVKKNAPQILEHYLRKNGYLPINREKTSTLSDFIDFSDKNYKKAQKIFFIGGGVCDVYQPAEEKVKITQKLLQLLYDYKQPVFLLTKNKLVLRDIELLKRINRDTYSCVNFTITLFDAKIQNVFEPNASTTAERFEAVKTLRKEGIHSGVYFYPVLPFIGDTRENMENIYQQAVNTKAEFVYCCGLTLKPGRSKDEFLTTIEKYFPALLRKYSILYQNNSKYGHLDPIQLRRMNIVWPEVMGYKLGVEKKIGYCAERYIPEGRHKVNIKIATNLIKIAYLKSNILQEPRLSSELAKLKHTAQFLEKYSKEINKLTRRELESLSIDKTIYPYIYDVIEKKDKIVFELERQAYESINLDTF